MGFSSLRSFGRSLANSHRPTKSKKDKDPGQDLFQIHHQERNHDRNFRSLGQLGHHTGQAEPPFALAKLALHRDPVKLILTLKFLLLFEQLRLLARPAQRRTR